MPFVHRLSERLGNAGTHADQRRLLDPELARDLIRCTEADAADVTGQSVRVLRDELDGIIKMGTRSRGCAPSSPQRLHIMGLRCFRFASLALREAS